MCFELNLNNNIPMSYLFTSESVSEGHPDKVADQISDALLDAFLRADPNSKVACETLVTTGLVMCSGEVKTKAYVDIQSIVRKTIKEIGYDKTEYGFDYNSCGVISTIHEQSADINRGVEREGDLEQGAGDQGMMFGYASDEMHNFMPLPLELSHRFVQELALIRKEGKVMTYLRPDAKSQVTIRYSEDHKAEAIDTIVVSTQHDEWLNADKPDDLTAVDKAERAMLQQIWSDIKKFVIPRVIATLQTEAEKKLFDGEYKLYVNPTGKFVIGGPHGDTGLTGRKIIVDTYGGSAPHGGGAFSGKDPSKVDRSAAYAARHLARNLVAAGVASKVTVQVAYAIGMAAPVSLNINTFGTAKVQDQNGAVLSDHLIAEKVMTAYDMRPASITARFGLKNPIYRQTAMYGHFGRDVKHSEVEVYYEDEHTYRKEVNGTQRIFKMIDFFAWEKDDYKDRFRKLFAIA